MKQTIAIACGGPSSEYEVSMKSTRAILSAIDGTKYIVKVFLISQDLKACLIDGVDRKDDDPERQILPLDEAIKRYLTNVDLVLLAGIHGEFAEDGRLQSLLDFYDIKYTGSDHSASALAMDKFRSSLIVSKLDGIKVPSSVLLDLTLEIPNGKLNYPVIFKPNNLGSSVGIKILNSYTELEEYAIYALTQLKVKQAIVQEYIENAVEVSCGCLERKNKSFIKLPPIEIIPNKSDYFDYDSKYKKGGAREICSPESINPKLSNQISELTCQIHNILGCKTYSRSDFLVQGKKILYIETNTLPGMTKTSLLPQEAKAAGISFTALIDFIIENS